MDGRSGVGRWWGYFRRPVAAEVAAPDTEQCQAGFRPERRRPVVA